MSNSCHLADEQGFETFRHAYRAAIKEVRTKIEILSEDFAVRHDYNPIHHMERRLKSPESIEEKLIRYGKEVSISSAKENIFESEKKLAEVRDNASKIIDDAREKAKLEKENILKEANQEANKVKTNAYKAIEEEKSKAKQEIKEDIVDVAFTMTSKLLEREVSDEDNKKIVDDFVKELDQDNKK